MFAFREKFRWRWKSEESSWSPAPEYSVDGGLKSGDGYSLTGEMRLRSCWEDGEKEKEESDSSGKKYTIHMIILQPGKLSYFRFHRYGPRMFTDDLFCLFSIFWSCSYTTIYFMMENFSLHVCILNEHKHAALALVSHTPSWHVMSAEYCQRNTDFFSTWNCSGVDSVCPSAFGQVKCIMQLSNLV